MRIPIVTALLMLFAKFVLGQEIDFGKLLDSEISSDQSIRDQFRDNFLGKVLPLLSKEDGLALVHQLPGLVVQFSRKEDPIRQDVSAILVVLAQSRADSATTLSQAFPALMDHVKDSVPRIRSNSVGALSSLNPDIPKQQLRFLIGLSHGADQSLADIALVGIMRMAPSDRDAFNVVQTMLSPGSSVEAKSSAVRAMTMARASEPNVLRLLAPVLTGHDPSLAQAALEALSQLGRYAIGLNTKEIALLAKGDNKTLAAAAQQLLDGYNRAQ